MKTVAAILITFIALTAFVEGPTKVVFYGTVVNDTTGLPMHDVDIRIAYGFSAPTKTDKEGNFRVEVEKKYCVDSIFNFYADNDYKNIEQKIVPGKHNAVRYKFKPWFEQIKVKGSLLPVF
ncbi:MAG: hypothetical protein M0D57_21385 [Sphingobacteriales bacterium JAD_PAG50586_3]|nr:MAG: hypothetical protein M0D57_21385 [Sphingobacteriales bacterium JAD_PAG50586_3]